MNPHDAFIYFLLVPLALVGLYHLAGRYLRSAERRALASFEQWAVRANELAHAYVDKSMELASIEIELMSLIKGMPPETSYQTIRKLGLGRQIEAAMLRRVEELGVGSALPPDPEGAPQESETMPSPGPDTVWEDGKLVPSSRMK